MNFKLAFVVVIISYVATPSMGQGKYSIVPGVIR